MASAMTPVWFVFAAAVAGVIRHGVNQLGRGWVGTLAINVVGAFVLGWLVGAGVSGDAMLVAGTAGCGSLTTFSTFALETVEARDHTRIAIVVTTLAGTLMAATVGYALG